MNLKLRQVRWHSRITLLTLWIVMAWRGIAPSVHAVDAKPPEQLYQQARQLYVGTGGTQDVARAVMLFEQAAEAGHAGAQLKLGVLNELGIGTKQDVTTAAGWYFKAASQGQPVAQTRLGVLLCQPLPPFIASHELRLGTNTVSLPDYEAGGQWLKAAADQGYAPAQQLLGDLLGVILSRWYKTIPWLGEAQRNSAGWYAKAAVGGMPGAVWQTANAYLDFGQHDEAYVWFLRAQSEGVVEAKESLDRLEPFLGPESKYNAQRKINQPLPSAAHPEWLEWHELVYLHNPGPSPMVSSNATRNFAALRAAAVKGEVAAEFNLALALQHEVVRFSGLVPMSKGAGHPMIPVVERDPARVEEAMRWYQLAALHGHRDAQFHLAILLRYGLAGTNDFPTAQKWFQAAAQAGHREAQYELALLLDEGFTGAAQPVEASKWFQKAAAAGHTGARQSLEQRTKVSGGTAAKPVAVQRSARLAIITLQPELKREADLLLVELGKQPGVELVERAEIDRILQEQGMAARQSRDYLKLGQLLQADGLLILEPVEPGKMLGTRWVAVGPGIVLGQTDTPLPVADLAEWSRGIAGQFPALGKKMTVTVRDAVPVSLLNLRSAITVAGDAGQARQLTVFLKHRLLRHPEVFVLERSRMDQLALEKDLTGVTAQNFWGGSYLLEGTLNHEGLRAGELSIQLRLTSPSRNVKVFSRSGPVNQPEKLLNELADQVVAELIQGARHLEWKTEEEAQQYFAEAQWAYRQGMFSEAQQASESAWALGLRSPEVIVLRIQSYAQDVSRSSFELPRRGPSPGQLEKLLTAMSIYIQQSNNPAFKITRTNTPDSWVTMGGGLVYLAANNLSSYAASPGGWQGEEAGQLARLRLISSELIPALSTEVDRMENGGAKNFLNTVVFGNALFHETPQMAGDQMREMIVTGVFRRALDLDRFHYEERKLDLTVWNGDPKGREILYKTYQRIFDEFEKDSGLQMREDILLGRLVLAVSPLDFEYYYRALADLAWEQREGYAQTDKLQSLVNQIKGELARRKSHQRMADEAVVKRLAEEVEPAWEARLQPWLAKREQRLKDAAQKAETARREEWAAKVKENREKSFAMSQRQVRKEQSIAALLNILRDADRAVPDLLVMIPRPMTEGQAREIQALMPAYRARVGADASYKFLAQRVAETLKQPVPQYGLPAGPEVPAYLSRESTSLPDWKSAHLPENPTRFSMPRNLPVQGATRIPMPFGLPPGMAAPGMFPEATAVRKSEPTNYLVLDTFWKPPARLTGEEQDMVTSIRSVDVWRDDVLLEVSRGINRGFGRTSWLRLRIEDEHIEEIVPPAAFKNELGSLPQMIRFGDDLLGVLPAGIVRCSLPENKWDILPVTLPQYSKLLAVSGRLIAHNKEGIYLVDLASASIKILASNRRRPAETALDGLPELYVSQVCGADQNHLIFCINGRLFVFAILQQQWSEMKVPERFNGKLKSLGDALLFGLRNPEGGGGFARLKGPSGQTAAFLEVHSDRPNVMFPSPEEVMQSEAEEAPRWELTNRSQGMFAMDSTSDVVALDKGFLTLLHRRPVGAPDNLTAEDLLGKMYLCLQGVDVPVELIPQAAGDGARELKARSGYGVIFSLLATKTHVVISAQEGAGLWLIAKDKLELAASEARKKRRQLMDEQIAEHPERKRLIKIRDEERAY